MIPKESALCSLTVFVVLMAALVCPAASYAEKSPASIFAEESNKVVLIASAGGAKDSVIGSGFVAGSAGLIVTNYHVIKNAREIVVKFRDGRMYKAHVIKRDPGKDIALLQIPATNLKPISFGDSDSVAIGERVVAIGNPLGLEQTVSDGLVSAVRERDGVKFLQLSVPLSKGSSGSPIFNLRGEVIGLMTFSLENGKDLNFAVPVNYITPLVGYSLTLHSKPKPSLVNGVYAVKAGDTLYSLSKKFDVTVDDIMKINNLRSSAIRVGQELRIRQRGSRL